VLFAYVVAGFIASPNWCDVLRGTFIPVLHWSKQNLSLLVAMLGTTISPYMFFWQASEEVEELQTEDQQSRDESDSKESRHGRLMDTISGMVYAVIVFYFIVLTSAATLHATGKTDINTAADAARALEPIAGHYASLLFSVGIIGAGLIAIPVLAGATAYPLAERLGRPEGLDKSVAQARFFYGVLGTSVLFGMAIALTPINPIDALVYSQVLMGLLTPILLVLMMLLAGDRHVMGDENVNNLYFNIFGWAAVVIMVLADLAMVWTFL
jgi:Mn2+/Fe2+ NRAMP family transporter